MKKSCAWLLALTFVLSLTLTSTAQTPYKPTMAEEQVRKWEVYAKEEPKTMEDVSAESAKQVVDEIFARIRR